MIPGDDASESGRLRWHYSRLCERTQELEDRLDVAECAACALGVLVLVLLALLVGALSQ